MHRAKGLEWENVIILDANEDITPYHKAETDEELEEERRMFYVAATRAKSNLTIYSIEKRNKTEMTVSRFVKEMLYVSENRNRDDQLHDATSTTQFNKGDWVFHKTFGVGRIMTTDNDKIIIVFENEGLKTLEKKWCTNNLQLFN
jgi:DNA helicase-2/ATP-dependent DNA helicase PcrA